MNCVKTPERAFCSSESYLWFSERTTLKKTWLQNLTNGDMLINLFYHFQVYNLYMPSTRINLTKDQLKFRGLMPNVFQILCVFTWPWTKMNFFEIQNLAGLFRHQKLGWPLWSPKLGWPIFEVQNWEELFRSPSLTSLTRMDSVQVWSYLSRNGCS